LNKVVDREACDFLKTQMDIQVEPDGHPVQFVIPEGLKDDQRLKAAREKAAFLNFEQRLGQEARKSWRENVKRRREEREREAEEEVPPARRSRWIEGEYY
jgi:hypothetical protein